MDDKIKIFLGTAAIIVMFIFAFAAVSFVSSYSKSIQPSSFRSFSVSAEGKIVAVPDVAQFTFSVITQGGREIASLQKENAEKVNKAIEFLKSNNIEAKDIKTQSYNLEPRYQYFSCSKDGACPPPEIVGYTVSQTASVKVRNFNKIGDVLSGVIQNGANSVSQLSFTVDDPTSLQNQARTEAIAKAKEKAKAIANAGDFRLGRLLSIEEGYALPYRSQSWEKSAIIPPATTPPSVPPTIEPGSQEIIVYVTLKYEIE